MIKSYKNIWVLSLLGFGLLSSSVLVAANKRPQGDPESSNSDHVKNPKIAKSTLELRALEYASDDDQEDIEPVGRPFGSADNLSVVAIAHEITADQREILHEVFRESLNLALTHVRDHVDGLSDWIIVGKFSDLVPHLLPLKESLEIVVRGYLEGFNGAVGLPEEVYKDLSAKWFGYFVNQALVACGALVASGKLRIFLDGSSSSFSSSSSISLDQERRLAQNRRDMFAFFVSTYFTPLIERLPAQFLAKMYPVDAAT